MIFFVKPRQIKLSGRNNVTLDRANFRPDIRQIFFGKKSGQEEFV